MVAFRLIFRASWCFTSFFSSYRLRWSLFFDIFSNLSLSVLLIHKLEPKKQRFAIRKISVGIASVLIGFTFAGFSGVSADEATTTTKDHLKTVRSTFAWGSACFSTLNDWVSLASSSVAGVTVWFSGLVGTTTKDHLKTETTTESSSVPTKEVELTSLALVGVAA